MTKGRSTYTFEFNYDANVLNNIIQGYLQANKFSLEEKNGEQYYKAGDAMVEGFRYFKYVIAGQTITIQAWFKGVFGEVPIEQNSLNMMAMTYRNSLNSLFQEISKTNEEESINQNNNQQSTQNNVNQFTQTFQEETTKKQEKLCEIGFWLAIFGLVASFLGVAYGVIIYILNFYFASQGLKTKKRGKAIATIILSIISILIIIGTLLSA